jgi:hypothetical protein
MDAIRHSRVLRRAGFRKELRLAGLFFIVFAIPRDCCWNMGHWRLRLLSTFTNFRGQGRAAFEESGDGTLFALGK